jgi:uncharacterized protein (TIGR02453 family)
MLRFQFQNTHMASPFTRKTLAFLRALKRNNDREWFKARKPDYETHVRAPMIELLARLARDFRAFAPELVADPTVSLFRIYRDTRFSGDKTPLKTHAAAHFPHRALGKTGGSGLYFEVAPAWVWIGGGIYMPQTHELAAIRSHIDANHGALRRIVERRTFVKTVGELHGEQLTRVPRGYPKEHPAAHYLRFRQFLAGREYPAEFAYDPEFYGELVTVFRQVAPLVRFLNTPILERPRDPLMADQSLDGRKRLSISVV